MQLTCMFEKENEHFYSSYISLFPLTFFHIYMLVFGYIIFFLLCRKFMRVWSFLTMMTNSPLGYSL